MFRRDTVSASYEQVVLSSYPNTILYFGSGSELDVISASVFYMTASYALTASNTTIITSASYTDYAGMASLASAVQLSQSYISSVTGSTQPAFQPATIWWDDNAKTYAIYSDHSGVSLQIGQENWLRAYAGEYIPNGSAVYVYSATGALPIVKLAQADAGGVKYKVIGVATETISSGSIGVVTSQGQVHDLNTLAYPAGSGLFLSSTQSGSWQIAPPSDPYEKVVLGYVLESNASSGVVQVDIVGIPQQNYSFVGLTLIPPITSSGGGNFTVGEARCNLCITSDGSGYVKNYLVPSASFTVNTSSVLDAQRVVVTYNSGSPIYQLVTNKTTVDNIQTVLAYTLTPGAGGSISQVNYDKPGLLLANKILKRVSTVNGIERASGVNLSESGSKGIVISSGVAWNEVNELLLPAVNSSGSRFVLIAHSASVWSASLITSFDNTRYDDGTNLQTLDNNKWVVNYVYRGVGSLNTSIVLLSTQYATLIDAQNSTAPAVPTEFPDITFLVGRAIYQQGASTATEIDSAYTNNFNSYPSFIGSNGYYPKWSSNTLSETSSLYEAANRHVLINSTTHPNPAAPETLLVNQIDDSSVNITTFQSDINDYSQTNIHNLNPGTSASSDIVATADNGDESIYYIDMGIGSSGYNDPRWTIFKPNDGYMYVNGGDLIIGTDTTGKKIEFFTDGAQTGSIKAYIDSTGIHASGSVDTASYLTPGATLYVVSGSNGRPPAFLAPYDYSADNVYRPNPIQEGYTHWDHKWVDWAVYDDVGARTHLGRELCIAVHNPSSFALPRLSPVYISGSSPSLNPTWSVTYKPDVYLAQADGTGTKYRVAGVVRQAIPSGSDGYILIAGTMHNSDMTPYGNVGQEVWLSPTVAGGLTTTKPGQPNEIVSIGYNIEAGSVGSLLVALQTEPPPANAFAGITSTITGSNKEDGTIVFTTGSVNLYDNPEGTGTITQFGLPQTTLNLITGSTNYVVAERSGSTAVYTLTTDSSYANGINIVRVATLDIYTGNPPGSEWDVHQFDIGIVGLALANRINNKDIRLHGYQRESGLTLYTTGSSGSFGITEGNVWYGPNSQVVPMFDITLPGYYTYIFHTTSSSGTSSWHQYTSSVFLSGYYDSGSVGLVPCTPDSWSVNFVYRLIGTDDEAAIVLSSQEFATELEASNNAATPGDLPSTIRDLGLLVGRFVVQSGSYIPTIESAFSNTFIPAVVTQHESLLGLQGGTGGEHYHLTLNDYNGTGTGLMVRETNATMSNPMFVAATPYHIPYWDINKRLTLTGSVQVVGKYVTINSASFQDPTNPEALLVNQANTMSVNTVGAYSSVNNFSQIYNQNFSTGSLASTDIVATADIGSQTSNYIDMGIASSTFNNPSWPWNGPSEGYLMMDGGTLWIGTITNHKIKFFINNTASVGYLDQTGAHITGSLMGTSSWAQYAVNWGLTSGSTLPVTASYAVSASYASNGGGSSLITGSTYPITSSWAENASNSGTTLFTGSTYPITASHAVTASYAIGMPVIKTGVIAGTSFGGNPKTSSVSFTVPFPDDNYTIAVTGESSRTWTIENKVSGSFQINTNSTVAFINNVFWQAISVGEYYNS